MTSHFWCGLLCNLLLLVFELFKVAVYIYTNGQQNKNKYYKKIVLHNNY